MSHTEEILKSGQSTRQVVKVGETVRRSTGVHSTYVHKLLNHLEEKEFPYAPRFLGTDDKKREILTFLKGELVSDNKMSTNILTQSIKILREFHDATSGTVLAKGSEVACHRDYAPWNVLTKNNNITGIIDFDEAAPGRRVNDLAYALWTFLDLGSYTSSQKQLDKIKLLSDIYGYSDGQELFKAIIREQKRILEKRIHLSTAASTAELREFSSRRIAVIKNQIRGVENIKDSILNLF